MHQKFIFSEITGSCCRDLYRLNIIAKSLYHCLYSSANEIQTTKLHQFFLNHYLLAESIAVKMNASNVPECFVTFACMPRSNRYKQQISRNLLFTVI